MTARCASAGTKAETGRIRTHANPVNSRRESWIVIVVRDYRLPSPIMLQPPGWRRWPRRKASVEAIVMLRDSSQPPRFPVGGNAGPWLLLPTRVCWVHCVGSGSDPLPLPLPLPEVPRPWPAEMTDGDAHCCEAQGGTAMKRPTVADSVSQALEPVAQEPARLAEPLPVRREREGAGERARPGTRAGAMQPAACARGSGPRHENAWRAARKAQDQRPASS